MADIGGSGRGLGITIGVEDFTNTNTLARNDIHIKLTIPDG